MSTTYTKWEDVDKPINTSPIHNVVKEKDYEQVCIWPGTILKDDQHEEFREFIKTELGVRIQILEVIFTYPTASGEGGRSDIFFAVHKDDMGNETEHGSFMVQRLAMGIRWIEDVLSGCNYNEKLYPSRVFKYKTWEC